MSLADRVFGTWLLITLTVLLGVTAVLASLGVFRQLSAAPVTLVAVRSVTPVPSAADNRSEHDATADSDAGPLEPAHAPRAPAPVIASLTAAPTPTEAAQAVVASESAEPPASPEPIASPKPAPVRERAAFGPPGPPRSTADVPIVMYHHVGPLPPNPDAIRRGLTVSPSVFAQTLDYLAEHEIETVTMAEVFDHFAGGPSVPKKSIVLTFDDGYDDGYEHAFKLLKARGMIGTFFITTDFVEHPGYLTWAQITEMFEAGMEIAAHSANHADFTKIGPNELRRQLIEPKQYLEQATGKPIRFLAYPAGKYNAAVMAATRAAGYDAAVTVIHGTHHTPALAFELRRVRANGADTVEQITARFTPAAWR